MWTVLISEQVQRCVRVDNEGVNSWMYNYIPAMVYYGESKTAAS